MSVHCKKKTPGEAQNPGALGGLAHCGLAIDHRIPAEQPGLEERLTRAIDLQRRRVEEEALNVGTATWSHDASPTICGGVHTTTPRFPHVFLTTHHPIGVEEKVLGV